MTSETKKKISKIRKGQKMAPFSIERRRNMSLARMGAKNHAWKGGISKINYSERKNFMASFDYQQWRESVFKRDDYICQHCKARSGNGKTVVLNADHIKPFAYFPELRLELSNGRTLCVPCHKKTDTFGGGVTKKYAIAR